MFILILYFIKKNLIIMFLSIHLNYNANNNKIIYYKLTTKIIKALSKQKKNYKGNVVYVTKYVYCNHLFFVKVFATIFP